MHRRPIQLASAALLLAVFSLPADAQVWTGRGRLQGEVLDSAGKGIEGARVTLRLESAPTEGPEPIVTDRRGRWSFLGLKGGAWNLHIEAEGYVPTEGAAQVNEYGSSPPRKVTLRTIAEAAGPEAIARAQAAQAAIDRGDDLLRERKGAEALAEYRRALGDVDAANRPLLLKRIATAQMVAGDDEGAVATLKEALELVPDDADALRLIIDRLTILKREEEAAAYLARMPEGTAIGASTLLNMAINDYNDGDLDGALEKLDQVIARQPDAPETYYYRGLTYLAQGKMAEAKADFEKLLALDPDHQHADDCREFLKSL
jgi:tetratricopeptide (TPR) repeat protein